jgi:hypothetical protein
LAIDFEHGLDGRSVRLTIGNLGSTEVRISVKDNYSGALTTESVRGR